MGMKIKGLDRLKKAGDELVDKVANEIRDMRAAVVEELVERLIENIPVWSGRTIASLWVDQTGAGSATAEPHPQRGGYSLEGPWHTSDEFGATSGMALGAEPMRARAETMARAQAMKARNMSIWDAQSISVTIASVPWALIEKAQAPNPNQHGRNRAVVSAIAVAAIRSKFAGLLK